MNGGGSSWARNRRLASDHLGISTTIFRSGGAGLPRSEKERGADGGKVPSTPRFSNARPGYTRNPPVTSQATPSHSHPLGPVPATIEATISSSTVCLILAPLSPPLE